MKTILIKWSKTTHLENVFVCGDFLEKGGLFFLLDKTQILHHYSFFPVEPQLIATFVIWSLVEK